jgi:GGDEF domain-containing protein
LLADPNLSSIYAELGSSAVESSLREMGVLLSGSLRRTDIVGRLGESQFAVLAIDASEPSGPVLCQRLQRRMAVLKQGTGSRGPLEVRMNAKFWSARDAILFSKWLDSVEAVLRTGPAALESRPQAAETLTKR